MSGLFQSYCAATLDDDHVKAKGLLKNNPDLARHGVAEKEHYEPGITHWIYAGDSVLHVAAAGYRVEIARMLLAAGADAAAGNRRDSQPLHYACDGRQDSPAWNARCQVAMIRLLLEAGADIDAQDKNGATPLHRAVRNRCAAAVQCLLDAGGAPNARNKPGSTPFHLAVQNTGRGGSGGEKARAAQREILQAFLKLGVGPAVKDARGRTVLEWARNDEIRQILSGHAD